jgi:hypothetical protein
MSTPVTVVLITMSALSLITSVTTLTIVIVGGRKVHADVEEAKSKANSTIKSFGTMLSNLEI